MSPLATMADADAAQTVANILHSMRDRLNDKKRLSRSEFNRYALIGFQVLRFADVEFRALHLEAFHHVYKRRESRRLLRHVFNMIQFAVDRGIADWAMKRLDKLRDGGSSVPREVFEEAWYSLPGEVSKINRARDVHRLKGGVVESIMKRARRLGLKTISS